VPAQEESLILRMRAAGARTTARAVDSVGASVKRTGAAAKTASSNYGRFSNVIGSTGKRLSKTSRGLKSAGSSFSALSLPILLGAGAAGKFAIDFDKAMRNVNSIAQLPQRQFQRLREDVLALAGPTAQAPQTLAEGLYDLVSSGFNARQSLIIMKNSAKAATAGLTDAATSTKVMAAVLNAYRMPATKAKSVSDILFRTVDRGVISFEALSQNIGDTLPFASSLGVSLTELGASTATMTKQGLPVPETYTRIRNLLQTMIKPGEGLSDAFKALGVESGEALIKQKGFQGALDAVIGTTDGTKASVAKLFPNIRALGGALALTGKNSKAANKDLKGMEAAGGATSRALKEQSKSMSYQWNKFIAQVKVLAIELGTAFMPILKDVTAWLGKVVKWFRNLSPSTQKWIVIIGLAIAVLGPLLILLGAVVAAGAALASTAGLIALGIGAVVAIVTTAYLKFGWFRDIVGILGKAFMNLPLIWIIRNLRQIVDVFKQIPGAIKGGLVAAVNFFIDRINNIIDVINGFIGVFNKLPNAISGGDIGEIGHVGRVGGGGGGGTGQGPTPFGGMAAPGRLATGGYVTRGGVFEVGERGRETVLLPAGAAVSPHGGGEAVLHNHIYIDGKKVAKSVQRVSVKKKSVE